MIRFNWEQKDWPNFTYSLTGIEDELFTFAERVGHITGILKALPEDTQMEALIDIMVAEAIKTSAIEGEYLSRQDVLSSIRKNLGLERDSIQIHDKKAEGIGRLMIDVRHTYKEPLTTQKLYDWHKMLMGESRGIKVGEWRTHEEPMQVISGVMGQPKTYNMKTITPAIADAMAYFRPILQRYARRLIKDEVAAAKIVDQVLEDQFLLDELSPSNDIRWLLKANLLNRCHCFIQFNILNRPPVKVPVRKYIQPLDAISKGAKYFHKLLFL